MSVNDLAIPLQGPAEPARRRFAAKPASVLFALASALLLGLGGYILAVDDPTGGEPVAIAAIEALPASEPAAAPPPADTPATPPADAGTAPADAAARIDDATTIEEQSGVRVVRPGTGAAPHSIIVRAPDEPTASTVTLSAVDDALLERGRHGNLPKVAEDGRRPLDVYARPVVVPPVIKARNPPRVAILVTGLGISATGTATAIRRLPPEVTLAFAPYGEDLAAKAKAARADGHEVMLQAPMEPFDFPDNDPGPQTLLTDATAEQNVDRLNWQLSRFAGYVGVTNYMGGRFTSSREALAPILADLGGRGLMFADDGSSPRSLVAAMAKGANLPAVTADVVIDAEPTAAAIDGALARLEELARERGTAFGVATGLPATIDRLSDFSDTLAARGVLLVPVSALVR